MSSNGSRKLEVALAAVTCLLSGCLYGGGAVAAVAVEADLFTAAAAVAPAAPPAALPAMIAPIFGGCADRMASRYGGATSSTLCTLGESAPLPFLLALRMLPVCRLRMLFVLEYRPPISSSLSKEKTRRCLVQFVFFAPDIGTFSASS